MYRFSTALLYSAIFSQQFVIKNLTKIHVLTAINIQHFFIIAIMKIYNMDLIFASLLRKLCFRENVCVCVFDFQHFKLINSQIAHKWLEISS